MLERIVDVRGFSHGDLYANLSNVVNDLDWSLCIGYRKLVDLVLLCLPLIHD